GASAGFQTAFDNRKPETRSARFTRPRCLGAEKRFTKAMDHLFGNTGTFVENVEDDPLGCTPCLDANGQRTPGVAKGISQDVGHRPFEKMGIGKNTAFWREVDLE
ncbi:MAG: hypothetical protein RLZZ399_2562, partial [Verrucomicrobiota bacterium]